LNDIRCYTEYVTSMATKAYAAKVCNRPSAVTYIAILVILMGFYGLVLGLFEINVLNKGLVSTHGILEAGIGTSEITVGIFALRGKGWAWKSLIVSQIAATTVFIMAFLYMIPLDPILFLGSIFAIPILPLLFRPKVKAYFGKSNFSLKHLMELDLEAAKHNLHYFRIAAILVSIFYFIIGFLLLTVGDGSEQFASWWLLMIISAISFGLTFLAYRRKSRRAGLAFIVLYAITMIILALDSRPHIAHPGYWTFSGEIFGIPLLQGVRSVSFISRIALL
jgi:hypothetical protein